MSNGAWVTCVSCGLKHSMRPDGLCPRCRCSVSPSDPYSPDSADFVPPGGPSVPSRGLNVFGPASGESYGAPAPAAPPPAARPGPPGSQPYGSAPGYGPPPGDPSSYGAPPSAPSPYGVSPSNHPSREPEGYGGAHGGGYGQQHEYDLDGPAQSPQHPAAQDLAPPAQPYGGPSTSSPYGTGPGYGSPNPPSSSFGASNPSYGAPSASYGNPSAPYGPPSASPGGPTSQYGAIQAAGYGQQSDYELDAGPESTVELDYGRAYGAPAGGAARNVYGHTSADIQSAYGQMPSYDLPAGSPTASYPPEATGLEQDPEGAGRPIANPYDRVPYGMNMARQTSQDVYPSLGAPKDRRFNWMSDYGVSQPLPGSNSSTQEVLLAIFMGLVAAGLGGFAWALVAYYSGYELGWLAIGLGFLTGIAVGLSGAGKGTAQPVAVLAVVAGLCLGKFLIIDWEVRFQEEAAVLAADDDGMFLPVLLEMSKRGMVPSTVGDRILSAKIFTNGRWELEHLSRMLVQYRDRVVQKIRTLTRAQKQDVALRFIRSNVATLSYWERIKLASSLFDILWFFLAISVVWRMAGGGE